MASSSGDVIYQTGEDRRPEWTGATAGYNEAGKVGVTVDHKSTIKLPRWPITHSEV